MAQKNNDEKNSEDCIFCKIIRGKIPVKQHGNYENFIVIDDAHPVSEGHCLIIPKQHYSTLFDLPSVLGGELIKVTKDQGLRLIKEGKAKGIKLGQNNFKEAGQAVMHFHMHVIPYK